MPDFSKRNTLIFVYSVLTLSILLVFWQVRNFDFVNYDDNEYVYENPHVLKGLTWDSIIWAFTSCYNGYWQPLTWLSLIINCQLFGPGPGGFHLVNLFLHLANTLLLFVVLRKMTGALWPSAFVAVAFAFHPMHVESVAWIAERKDVLSTLFWLLTMLTYVRYVDKPSVSRYVITLIVFALGLMSKPMLVTLPFVLLLLDYWPLLRFATKGRTLDQIRNLFLEKIPFFVLAAVSGVVTFLTQRAGGLIVNIEVIPLKQRLVNAFFSYVAYIGKLFVPHNLAVHYPFNAASGITLGQFVLYALLLVGVSLLVLRFWNTRKYLLVGWLWFLGTLIPVIGLVQFTGSSYADRFTYIPYIGLFIMLAWGLPELLSKWSYRRSALGVSAALALMALGTGAYRQAGFWKNGFTLFSHAVEVTTNNHFAHNNLGTACQKLGRYQDAVESFKQAIKIRPDFAEAYFNLGNTYLKLDRYQDALEAYKQAIRLKPGLADAYCGLGAACGNLGRYQDAVESFKQAIKIKPDFIKALDGLGMACINLGRNENAITAYQQVLRIKPDFMEAYIGLGAAYRNLGRWQDALQTYQSAIKIRPDFTDAYVTLGVTYDKLGRLEDAIYSWKQALKIKPDFAEVYSNLGAAFYKLGRYQEAIESFKQAVRIKPNYVDAHSNLGIIYLAAGDKNSALEEYKILKALGAKQADQLYNLIYK